MCFLSADVRIFGWIAGMGNSDGNAFIGMSNFSLRGIGEKTGRHDKTGDMMKSVVDSGVA